MEWANNCSKYIAVGVGWDGGGMGKNYPFKNLGIRLHNIYS